MATNTVRTHLLPTNMAHSKAQHNWHPFIIFEMALSPLWPFTVPNKYICRGARHKRTNPNHNTTPFPWTLANSRACMPRTRAASGAHPLSPLKTENFQRRIPTLRIRPPPMDTEGAGAQQVHRSTGGSYCKACKAVDGQDSPNAQAGHRSGGRSLFFEPEPLSGVSCVGAGMAWLENLFWGRPLKTNGRPWARFGLCVAKVQLHANQCAAMRHQVAPVCGPLAASPPPPFSTAWKSRYKGSICGFGFCTKVWRPL